MLHSYSGVAAADVAQLLRSGCSICCTATQEWLQQMLHSYSGVAAADVAQLLRSGCSTCPAHTRFLQDYDFQHITLIMKITT